MKVQGGIGSVYGTSRDRPFDRWFRYPAGFSADALALAVAAAAPQGARVVDPFCGAGTVPFALPEGNSEFVGIEAHPLIAELAALKLRARPGTPDGLRVAAAQLVDDATPSDPEKEHPLVHRCFDPPVLARLAGLRDALAARPGQPWSAHLRWALVGALRDVASVKVGWPYQRPALRREPPHADPSARVVARAHAMADDLESRPVPPTGRIVRGDARTPAAWRAASTGEPFAACVTSPPYLNNFDYADATRLELFFLRRAASWAEMCRTVRAGMVTATTQQTRRSRAQRSLTSLRRYPHLHASIVHLTDRLAHERAQRSRGKEYDQLLPSYFADLARVLHRLHENTSPGAKAAWVIGDSAPYGVHVDTPHLVARLAEDIGFTTLEVVGVRSRGLRWRTNGTRHQVPLVEQLVVFAHSG